MATVKTYSLKKDGDKSLSKNFKVREFRCKDGSDEILICQETVDILQAVRNYFGQPVTINSAYRTPTWNKKVGGASSSQHVKGTACDIKVANVPSWAVVAYLEANYPKHGIGFYSTFVHIDSRGFKVYWKNTGSNVVTGFGYGIKYQQYKAKTIVESTKQKITEVVQDKKQEEEEMTLADFGKMYDALMAEKAKQAKSNWGEELDKAIEWAQ